MSYNSTLHVTLMRDDVGFHEGPSNDNPYSEWQYNVRRPAGGWCCSYASYAAYRAGFRFGFMGCTFGDKGDNNAGVFREHAKNLGLFRERTARARPGWLVPMFAYDRGAHLETVLADDGGTFIATIGGNTGDMVQYRTRPRGIIEGFIALDEAGQNAQVPPATPKEIRHMGMVASCMVPGAKMQTKGEWTAHMPMVGAWLQPDGTTELCGVNGVELKEQKRAGFGVSVYPLGRLQKPVVSIDPVMMEQLIDGPDGPVKVLKWTGDIVALAGDGGTFHTHVKTIKYL